MNKRPVSYLQTDARCKSNTHRLDKLVSKVDTMEAKPAKRWESLVDKLLLVAAGAFLGWLAAGMPGL